MAGDPQEPKKRPSPKVFNCTNCGASIPLRALGHTVTVACASCGSIIDVTNENLQVINTVEHRKRIKPLIPLGRRGKLFGDTWEVIGFMERSDGSGEYKWQEYLLFNPYKGFRWLTVADGHWNFVRTTKERPLRHGQSAWFRAGTYKLFHKGTGKVTYVIGEFYWRVKVDDAVAVEDYINPPYILSLERDAQEINWSAGEYLEPEVVKSAFKLDKAMPARSGIAPNQPSALVAQTPGILKLAGFFILVAILIQAATFAISRNQVVFQGSGVYDPAERGKTQVTPSFDLAGAMSNVGIRFNSPVNNNWLSLEGSLINEETGAEYDFDQGVEFYSGHDSDGYWSEGDQRSMRVLSLVPGGRYHVVFQVSGPPELRSQEYNLSIRRGVVTWSNFWWSLVLLALFPAFVWWRSHQFEVARWSQSDFSPYVSDDDDE